MACYNPAMRGEETIKMLEGDSHIWSSPLVHRLIEDFRAIAEHRTRLIHHETQLESELFRFRKLKDIIDIDIKALEDDQKKGLSKYTQRWTDYDMGRLGRASALAALDKIKRLLNDKEILS